MHAIVEWIERACHAVDVDGHVVRFRHMRFDAYVVFSDQFISAVPIEWVGQGISNLSEKIRG